MHFCFLLYFIILYFMATMYYIVFYGNHVKKLISDPVVRYMYFSTC